MKKSDYPKYRIVKYTWKSEERFCIQMKTSFWTEWDKVELGIPVLYKTLDSAMKALNQWKEADAKEKDSISFAGVVYSD